MEDTREDKPGTPAVLVFYFLIVIANVSALDFHTFNVSMKLSMEEHLQRLNKPPIKSIQSPDGDIIDCIHYLNQPAFDHPLLKTHKFPVDPPRKPTRLMNTLANRTGRGHSRQSFQAWHINGICPDGTIPVRRTMEEDLMRVDSPHNYGKKSHDGSFRSLQKPDTNSGNGHEHAIVYVEGEEYYGAKATMNVWDPKVKGKDEFSLSQIWVLGGSFEGPELNSIEAGWQVSPQLYGDNKPRLFTYWTSDSYMQTGCYNLLCSGFVQTNNKIAMGAAISPISKFSGPQYDITILIWKDLKGGNWWMEFGEGVIVGYWPKEVFTHLAGNADMIQWGGEVVNSGGDGGGHTSTQMGSGHFAEEGFGRSSYLRNVEIVDEDNNLRPPDSLLTLAEYNKCYDVQSFYNTEWGSHLYFGGPGNNPNCP